MKRVYFIIIIVFLHGYFQSLYAQRAEIDISVSPFSDAIMNQAAVISTDFAVRYKVSDAFAVGLGINPTFLKYTVGEIEINYLPVYLSFRYQIAENKYISPYFLLNLGGSFIQLEPDPEFQGRVAIGTDFIISQRCSLFVELGVSYITTRTLWSPFSFGIRL